ncbi:MAG: AraC family transcriptional regulator [Planctomycetota bacterium]
MLVPSILESRRIDIDSEWRFDMVCSPFWRVYLNARSGACVRCSGRVYKITPGRAFVVPAWLRFDCWSGCRMSHRYLHFGLDGLSGAVTRRMFDAPFQVDVSRFPGDPWPARHQRLPEVVREAAAVAWAQAVVVLAFDRLPAEQMAECRPFLKERPRMRRVLDYIERNLSRPIANDELAAEAHLSPGQFIRRFGQEIGQTPAQYVRERRVTAAASRLRLGDDSIETIAADTGFGDRSYFSRTFKEIMGTSPAAYRRSRRV